MNDLIRRKDAIEKFADYVGLTNSASEAYHKIICIIKSLPSVEPEQKIGHWIDTDNYYQRWKCSECGYHTRDAEPNYCPSCGADMRMRGK